MPAFQRFNLSALLRLTRFWNLAVIGFAQYFTAVFLVGRETLFDVRLFLLSFSTILIAAAGYIINDYYDIKIDLINKPERVVIGKNITRRYAIFFHTLLSITGVAIGLFLGWLIAFINFLSSFILWLYSNNLKRQPFVGNFTVGFLTGLSIYLVNILYYRQIPLVTIYAVFAFFMTLVREIIKDIEDLKGDNTFGCKTLPIVWGVRNTKLLIYLILLLFSGSVFLLNFFYTELPMLYLAIFLYLPLCWLWIRLTRADTIRDFSRLSSFCKLIMLLGILSMAFV
jgi:4-hydroxybenzoate polyprenyltransferase